MMAGRALSQALAAGIQKAESTRTRLGIASSMLADIGHLVITNQAEILAAVRSIERGPLVFPFAWGLNAHEMPVLRALVERPGLKHEEILELAQSRGEPRAIVHRIVVKMRRVIPEFEIPTARGRGYGLREDMKDVVRAKAIGP